MPKYTTADIRNLAFVGSAGAGKTTLVEAMLHAAGVIGRAGRVEEGNTVCDYDELEKEFSSGLDSALVHFDHEGAHVNLIDTPGSGDFLGKAISSLPAVDTVVVVVDPGTGIDPVMRRLMKTTGEHGKPRLIVVNKIDHGESLVGGGDNLRHDLRQVVTANQNSVRVNFGVVQLLEIVSIGFER